MPRKFPLLPALFTPLLGTLLGTLLASCSQTVADDAPVAGAPRAPLEQGSPWPKFRGNAAQDGASSVRPSRTGGALWTFQTGKGIFSSPVVASDGTVYIGSADRSFYAIGADGKLRWKLETGEIIDSAALLDDRGRVYFGSGDGKLRARDARTGAEIWTLTADDPRDNKAFINWFEGNVAIGPSGTLYVPNDNFNVYAVDRDTGAVRWRFKMPDQTWSLPAVDVATEDLFIGNNNLLPALGKNTFGLDKAGQVSWAASTLGTIAASPMLTPDGKVVVGGFDGYVRAYSQKSGDMLWEFPTRDHIYASPARLPDGTVVQASADGTIYALDPGTGRQRWAFDTREPIRSSPAVDGDGNIYFGSGEGRLFVLSRDGTLRFSMRLVDDERNDLNASPALGKDAIYIAGESGQIFSVPYDHCLRPEASGDGRCAVGGGEGLPDQGAELLFTSRFGALVPEAPARIDGNQPVTLSLVVRGKGDTVQALLASGLSVKVDPPAEVSTEISGDGKFVTITPKTRFPAGKVTISASGKYLVDMERKGLRLSGGKVGGEVSSSLSFTVDGADLPAFPLPVARAPGEPTAIWEVSRLAIPMPTIMPSYNQIGFDSLHYLVGLVEEKDGKGVAFMVGGKLAEGEVSAVIDPGTRGLFPLALRYDGGLLTLANQDGLSVEVMNFTLPFKAFRIATRLGPDGNARDTASMSGGTTCGTVPFYGPFLQQLGLCNPESDAIRVYGGANFRKSGTGVQQAPSGLGQVSFALGADSVTATLTGSALKLADHVTTVLLVDDLTGDPVTLGYGLDTTRAAGPGGELTGVTVPFSGKKLPSRVRAYLMVDTYPAAKGVLESR